MSLLHHVRSINPIKILSIDPFLHSHSETSASSWMSQLWLITNVSLQTSVWILSSLCWTPFASSWKIFLKYISPTNCSNFFLTRIIMHVFLWAMNKTSLRYRTRLPCQVHYSSLLCRNVSADRRLPALMLLISVLLLWEMKLQSQCFSQL